MRLSGSAAALQGGQERWGGKGGGSALHLTPHPLQLAAHFEWLQSKDEALPAMPLSILLACHWTAAQREQRGGLGFEAVC